MMFSLNQATLLFSQLSVVCHVLAESLAENHRSMLVTRGDPVMLTCNVSMENATQINWTKGTSVFAYSTFQKDETFSNFSSDGLKIDVDLPSKLTIPRAQPDDAGLYTCIITNKRGVQTIKWNLTVSEKPKEISSPSYFLYILTPAIGLLLCGILSAVCICRKLQARTLTQDAVHEMFHSQSGGEVAFPQPQSGRDHWTNNKRRSQYMERLNSIYDHM